MITSLLFFQVKHGSMRAVLISIYYALLSHPVAALDNLPNPSAEVVQQVIYPAPENATDHRFDDMIEYLRIALDLTVKQYGPYKMMASPFVMNESRYVAEIKNNTGKLNLMWSSTSPDKERDLQPVRISLTKDLLGYRIALIHSDSQAKINSVKTLDDLRKLKIGQGRGWGDNLVYRENGITVEESNYNDLFRMTTKKVIDLFPRGITEVFAEYELNHAENPGLAIESGLVIYYPWPYYFFTSHKDKVLAQRIEKGLQMMLADGSFDKLFNRYHQQQIEKANLKKRRIIRIENPYLPKEVPVGSGYIQPLDMPFK